MAEHEIDHRRPVRAINLNTAAGAIAIAAFAIGLMALAGTLSITQALLFLTGGAFGLALYHASFGFTAAYRVLFASGRSAGIRAQMAMLGLACLLFFPALAAGSLFGTPVSGFVAPAGTSVAVGAFIFGIGMQLGGACASGTLFTVGGGNMRMVATLIFFIVGSVIGLEHLPWWQALPSPPAFSMIKTFGWLAALGLNIAVFAAVWFGVSRIEHALYGNIQPILGTGREKWHPAQFLRGPWPLIAGALALALLNFATLYLAGRPWGITSAFPLWGAKVMDAFGVDMSGWQSWTGPHQQNALKSSIFNDVTSVMNFGIILGALIAATLSRRFNPSFSIPIKQLAASVVGGLILGYGARLAYGCNIGAFFGGVVSGSLHGWLWIVCALAGNWAGMYLRPLFGMQVEWRENAS